MAVNSKIMSFSPISIGDDERLEELCALLNEMYQETQDEDNLMQIAADLMNEEIEAMNDDSYYVSAYYLYCIALYISANMYQTTILFDTEAQEFQVTTWGSWHEAWLSRHPEAIY